MANTPSARKAHKQGLKRRQENIGRLSALKTSIKKVHAAVAAGADQAQVQSLFNAVQAQCARAASKCVMHKNTASRKVSRLALRITAAQQAA